MLDRPDLRQSKIGWGVLAFVALVIAIVLMVRYLTAHHPGETASPDRQTGLLDSDESSAELLLAPVVIDTPTPTVEPTPQPVVVYISGAVQQPDVYEVLPDARVVDVVNAAGGLTDDAAREYINLAAHVRDAQHIHVPRVGEDDPPPMPAEPGEQALSTNTGSSDEAAGETIDININTATAADLEMLPGIGEVMAQRIIDHRTENGAFRTIEDLQQVPGIGPVLLENIRAYVRVE